MILHFFFFFRLTASHKGTSAFVGGTKGPTFFCSTSYGSVDDSLADVKAGVQGRLTPDNKRVFGSRILGTISTRVSSTTNSSSRGLKLARKESGMDMAAGQARKERESNVGVKEKSSRWRFW
jgi:hypothetical protein